MTKLIRIFTLSLILLLTQQVSNAAVFLEGFYKSKYSSITMQLQETRDGIRVKRSGANNWITYQEFSRNLFKDSYGNGYYFYGDNEVEFRDRTGRTKITFFYDQRDSRSGVGNYNDWDNDSFDNDRYDNDWNNRNNNANRNDRYENRYRFLRGDISGRWTSGNRGQRVLQIRQTGRNLIEVQRNGRWRTFYYQGNGVFQDRNRNRVFFNNQNALTYRERFGGITRTYYRDNRFRNNRGNQWNQGNNGNRGNQWNRGNNGNRGNRGNQGNRGNRGYCPPGY